jgi:hypothetical protein
MQLANLWMMLALDEQDCEMQLRCIQQTDRKTLSAPDAAWLTEREGALINELNKLRRLRMATPKQKVVAIAHGGRA